MVVPDPPVPFHPATINLAAGTGIFRVLSNRRGAVEFNPGMGGPTRFAFFGDPKVPVLYAAQTPEAAVCETLLHDIPIEGGYLRPRAYQDKVGAKLTTTRRLKLASFHGDGLRTLKTRATQLTDTNASEYPQTVKWAEAAHAAGFDGIVWMSARRNTDRAYVLFGDRVAAGDLMVDASFAQVFAAGQNLDWLINYCAPQHVQVLLHAP